MRPDLSQFGGSPEGRTSGAMALKRNFPRPPPKWNATADSPTPGVVKGNRRWTRRLTSRASVQGPPKSRREVMRLVWPRPANARWGRAEHARHRVTLLMLTKLPPIKHCDNKSRSSDEVCGGSTFKIDANAAKPYHAVRSRAVLNSTVRRADLSCEPMSSSPHYRIRSDSMARSRGIDGCAHWQTPFCGETGLGRWAAVRSRIWSRAATEPTCVVVHYQLCCGCAPPHDRSRRPNAVQVRILGKRTIAIAGCCSLSSILLSGHRQHIGRAGRMRTGRSRRQAGFGG